MDRLYNIEGDFRETRKEKSFSKNTKKKKEEHDGTLNPPELLKP